MRTSALIFAAALATASAQDAYNHQLRGDRFLSVSTKAEKETSVATKAAKSSTKSSKTDKRHTHIMHPLLSLTSFSADAKAEKVSSSKAVKEASMPKEAKAEKEPTAEKETPATSVAKAAKVMSVEAKAVKSDEESSSKAAKAVDAKAEKASSVATKAAKTKSEKSVSTKATKETGSVSTKANKGSSITNAVAWIFRNSEYYEETTNKVSLWQAEYYKMKSSTHGHHFLTTSSHSRFDCCSAATYGMLPAPSLADLPAHPPKRDTHLKQSQLHKKLQESAKNF
eukprot:scaffold33521_cov130-Skeletonema_dohrnii-CCMP3373.AAC.4